MGVVSLAAAGRVITPAIPKNLSHVNNGVERMCYQPPKVITINDPSDLQE
jgi:hypothetical protein